MSWVQIETVTGLPVRILGIIYQIFREENIDKICTDYPEGNARTDALLQKGGTCLPAALLYYGIMLLLASLVINLAGPSFVQYAMAMTGY